MKRIRRYPVSISWELYEKLDNEYQNIGWIYNPYGNCWSHYFHTKKELSLLNI